LTPVEAIAPLFRPHLGKIHQPTIFWTSDARPHLTVYLSSILGGGEGLRERRGTPAVIQVDNGTEFASRVIDQWAYQNQVALHFIERGKPTQNALIESFNGKFRDECLNQNWFVDLRHAREVIEPWRVDYNTVRPHSSLRYLTAEEFAASVAARPASPSRRSFPSPRRGPNRMCRNPGVLT
jgi:putative transposase